LRAWVFGAGSFADLIRKVRDYTLDGIADRITAPTLIMDPEKRQAPQGPAELFGPGHDGRAGASRHPGHPGGP
jgi:hypothetical protein